MYNMSGGLSGKARREHRRSRATRIHTEQLIAEYEEAEDAPTLVHVPIRRRGEFLQTAPEFTGSNDPSDSGAGMQLHLPLAGVVDLSEAGGEHATEAAQRPNAVSADEQGSSGSSPMTERDELTLEIDAADGSLVDASSDDCTVDEAPCPGSTELASSRPVGPVRRRALGIKTMSRPPVGWATGSVVEPPRSPFSVQGFAYGCALGAAGAAAMLVVVQMFLG